MKKTSFKNTFKQSRNGTPGTSTGVIARAARIASATEFLQSTRVQFSTRVSKAKSRLSSVETGVLAGPVARHR